VDPVPDPLFVRKSCRAEYSFWMLSNLLAPVGATEFQTTEPFSCLELTWVKCSAYTLVIIIIIIIIIIILIKIKIIETFQFFLIIHVRK
jgi:hypothetical protein